MLGHQPLKLLARTLRAAIGVMHERIRLAAPPERQRLRHKQCLGLYVLAEAREFTAAAKTDHVSPPIPEKPWAGERPEVEVQMAERFAGKVAVVTGGGSGIGEEICRRLSREGAQVGVLDVDSANGKRVAADLVASGHRAMYAYADVVDDASMREGVGAVLSAYGRLDLAVNNAGIGGGIHPIPEFPVEDWTRTIMVNLVGVFNSLRAELPAIAAAGSGAIVNMSSMVGAVAHPLSSAYVASKHGVVGLTKSAALEWGSKNIRINAVGPTWVRTPLTESVWSTDAEWAKFGEDHPIGRCATAADIAALVTFLLSDEASIITGSLYLADGGYTAR